MNPYIPTLVLWISGGVLVASIAARKGKSFYPWLIYGLLLWIVALPVAMFSKPEDPLPSDKSRTVLGGTAIVGAIGVLCGLALIVTNLPAAGLPKCDGTAALADTKSAIANAPIGKVRGIAIVTISQVEELSRSPTEVRCTGLAKLNNGTDAPLNYRFYVENDQTFVFAQFQ